MTKTIEERARGLALQIVAAMDSPEATIGDIKRPIATAMREVVEECAGVAESYNSDLDETSCLMRGSEWKGCDGPGAAIRARFNLGGDDE